jgi:Ni/Co efflux regulator RcnB
MVNKILMAMFVTAAVAFAPIAATAQTGAAPAEPEKTTPEKAMPETGRHHHHRHHHHHHHHHHDNDNT